MHGLFRLVAALAPIAATVASGRLGQFVEQRDIGSPHAPGSASYDPRDDVYRITGVGRNMWADHDDFHFVWKRMSGDLVATARLNFVTPAPKPEATGFLHRKGGIVLRQDLDPDSAYVDVLRMGNRQMSLQYREVKGGLTRLIWVNTPHQDQVRLIRAGDYAYLGVPGPDGRLRSAGGSFKVRITGAYYVGLGVCPHDDVAHETMDFRDVRIAPAPRGLGRPAGQTLQTINIDTVAEQTALFHAAGPVQATGWSRDGKWVRFTSGGAERRAAAWDSDAVEPARGPDDAVHTGRAAAATPGGFSARLSPDGRQVAFLTGAGGAPSVDQDVTLRIAPVVDGTARTAGAVTLVKFWGDAASLPADAWSPDGKTIAFVSHD